MTSKPLELIVEKVPELGKVIPEGYLALTFLKMSDIIYKDKNGNDVLQKNVKSYMILHAGETVPLDAKEFSYIKMNVKKENLNEIKEKRKKMEADEENLR